MDYITTTNLRTKSSELVSTLKKGEKVMLVHRSKIIGVIKPMKEEAKPLTEKDVEELETFVKEINLPHTTYEERERRYRAHLMKKYGKGLS